MQLPQDGSSEPASRKETLIAAPLQPAISNTGWRHSIIKKIDQEQEPCCS